MRKIVFQMMTTLNGRLDDPIAWVHGVSDDHYRRIDSLYATYDTVLVGRTTYEEMAAYWPGALNEGTQTNRTMARRMNDYKKLVFSRSGREGITAWNNAEQVITADDRSLAARLTELKAEAGGNLHLSGGASFAQAVIGLGLVDEFHFFVYPVFSPGKAWFERLSGKLELQLAGSEVYEDGVTWLHYVPRETEARTTPASFTDLLT